MSDINNGEKTPKEEGNIILVCSSCGDELSWTMSSYWYSLWEQKRKYDKKYKGIRCKHCGKYNTVKPKIEERIDR